MNKYTLIYSVKIGSGFNYMTCVKRVTTNNLDKLLKLDEYNNMTYFVFEGWPQLAGDNDPIIGEEFEFKSGV